MFAMLLSEKMDPFYQNIGSFPTVIYTVLLGVCMIFWASAVLGIFDIDVIDLDIDGVEIDSVDINSESGEATAGVLSGLMLRFGLVGVPVTVSITILVMIGWLLCYYAVHFIFPFVPGALLKYVAGLPIFLVTLYLSAKITSVAIRPLKMFFAKATQQTDKKVIGQVAVVRTSRVDNDFGEAILEDGGAGLIMKVRSGGDDRFSKGDKVVIFEKLNDDNIYRVISEEEFMRK